MSDISLDFHLGWFWLGFAAMCGAWVWRRMVPRQDLRPRMSWLAVALLAPVIGIVGGVLLWIAAAWIGGWL